MSTRVCAVLITFNRLDTLKTALAHILAQTVRPTIVVVDNNSSDGTREYLESLNGNENLVSIFMESNVGSAGGIAAGMKYGLSMEKLDYFWILDDDTFYQKDALKELVENIEGSPFSLIGLSGFNIRYGNKVKTTSTDKLQEVDYALIDGAIIKADVVRKLGTTRPGFFMMGDDHEYSLRLTKHGYKIGLLNLGQIERLYLGGAGAFTKATLWRGYYSSRNHMLIIKQYFSFINLFAYCVRQLKFIIAAAFLAPDRFKRIKFRMLGILHGIRGIEGKTLDPKTLKFTYEE